MRFLVVPLFAALALVGATSARATPTDKDKAKALYAQGRKLFSQKQYLAAIRKFKQARRFWKHRSLLFNIAAAYAHLKKPVAAVTYLRLYLKHAKPSERKVPPFLKKMRQQVGVIVVEVLHRNAAIWINGRVRGYSRVELVLRPGRVKASVRLGNRVVARREVTLAGGGKHNWEVYDIPTTTVRPRARPRPRPRRRIPTLVPPQPRRRRPAGVVAPKRRRGPKHSRRTMWRALFGSTLGAGGVVLVASIFTYIKARAKLDEQTNLIDLTQHDPNPVDPNAEDPCQDAANKAYAEIVAVCNRRVKYEKDTYALVGAGFTLVAISMAFVYHAFIKKPAPATLTPTFGRDSAALSLSLDF